MERRVGLIAIAEFRCTANIGPMLPDRSDLGDDLLPGPGTPRTRPPARLGGCRSSSLVQGCYHLTAAGYGLSLHNAYTIAFVN